MGVLPSVVSEPERPRRSDTRWKMPQLTPDKVLVMAARRNIQRRFTVANVSVWRKPPTVSAVCAPMHLMKTSSIGILAACVVGTAPLALGQQMATAPAIGDVRSVTFPAYNAYRGIARYAPTAAEYARAVGDRDFVMERVTYRSDDLEVYAYLYRPVAPPKGNRLPVVVFNRGSYVRDDFSPEVLMLGNRLARQGYVVVAPMLRGSGGARGRDEMGGTDLHDLMNIVPVIKEIPYADLTRLFLYGESRGGLMCLLAAKHDFPARAIAVYGAITDFGSFLAEGSPARRVASSIWPDFSANEAEIVESRSAMRWPEKINLPVLLMNGGADTDVSPLQAILLASTLEKLGKRYELKIFYGETHVLTGRAQERDDETVRWFRRFDEPPATP
jgi:dipeptidyl aminopeptidase/acylaminoacyl peptidase